MTLPRYFWTWFLAIKTMVLWPVVFLLFDWMLALWRVDVDPDQGWMSLLFGEPTRLEAGRLFQDHLGLMLWSGAVATGLMAANGWWIDRHFQKSRGARR